MKPKYWLLIIFILTLTTKIVLSFYISNFTYETYFHLRQVEHILETGLPLYQDPLSYGGQQHIFLPFFHYVIAFFSLFLPLTLVAKILPNLLLSSLTLIVFLISIKITQDHKAALLSALIAGFLPILFFTNTLNMEAFFLPLAFLSIYCFLNLNQKKYLYLYILLFLILCFTSSAVFLLLVGFGIYLLLSLVEGKKVERAETELILFSLFFYIWSQFLFFKKTLIQEGLNFFWQNVPNNIIQEYFPSFSISQALIYVSIIPFLAGVYVVYTSLFQLKNKKSFLLISIAISTTLLVWLRLILFKLSLAFFGIILAIFFSLFYQDFIRYLKDTKLLKFKKIILPSLIILLFISMAYPAITFPLSQRTPSNSEIEAFKWLNENTPPDATILALLEEGNLITYYSQRKNLADDQFSLVKNIEEQTDNLISLFNTPFQTQALEITDKYHIKYLVLTPYAQEKHQLTDFRYTTNSCFKLIYNRKETKIYEVMCTLTIQ